MTSLIASLVLAQALGDGRLGPLLVTEPGQVINHSSAILADAPAGTVALTVGDSTPFAVTDAVLVVQTQWSTGPREAVGTFEIHRVARVAGSIVELDTVLSHAFTAFDSQLITLPEYTNVSLSAGASLIAPNWNGSSGGVLALLVTGAVVNQGALTASGAGFRGGQAIEVGAMGGCSELDLPPPLGSQRGEGLQRVSAIGTGRGNNDTGGGGGVCRYSGGGGGGHYGSGGVGGRSGDGLPVGGVGGAAFKGAGLVLGGGGGAANGSSGHGTNGGAGGGVVFVRALQIEGSGVWTSEGVDSLNSTSADGPGAGGGAAGTVWLEVSDVASECTLSARGGRGGSSLAGASAGGGGGGGLVILHVGALSSSCPADVSAGAPGLVSGLAYGAGPGGPLLAENVGFIDLVEGNRADGGYGPSMIPRGPRGEELRSFTGCDCSQASAGLWWAPLGLLCLLRRRR